jgi:HAD superfamily hydrolase (TIGR01509 family)
MKTVRGCSASPRKHRRLPSEKPGSKESGLFRINRILASVKTAANWRTITAMGKLPPVIFDLDGLLADTEYLHCRAYQMAFLECGLDLQDCDYAEHWVRHGKGISDWVALRRLSLDPQALRLRKAEHYLALLSSSLRPMSGARELLQQLSGKTSIALASSSYRDAVDGVLTGLGIAHFFHAIVTGLDVAQVKPAPDIFLKAAADLGANPSDCVVVEDAEKGVLAAHAAGMRCIAVPNDYTRHHDFSSATKVCSSLSEITPELLRDLPSPLSAGLLGRRAAPENGN